MNNLKKSDTWKIQLTIAFSFIYPKNNDEERVMHSKTDNIKIIINDKADEVIQEHFQSLPLRYQIGLKTSMIISDFILDCLHFLYYKCHKINFKRGGLYIDSYDWIKKKQILSIKKINAFNAL